MWRFFFLICLLALPCFCHSQNAPITERKNRIGDTISLYEREYFGLFQRTAGFAFATLGKDPRGANITIHYSEAAKQPTSLVIDPTTLRDLYDFTNNYEYYAKDAAVKFNPRRLAPLDLRLPMVRYENKGRQAEIYDKAGNSEFGEVFYVTDSTLALWMLDLGYDWEFARSNVKVFRLADLNKILLFKRVPSQWIGGAVGLATALVLISTNTQLPDLGNDLASSAFMVGTYSAAGFGLGYAVENLFRFKKTYNLKATEGSSNGLNSSEKEDLKQRAMFPGKVPPEFVGQP